MKRGGKMQLPYSETWYMVAEYHLNLGPNDKLEAAVNSKFPLTILCHGPMWHMMNFGICIPLQ